MNDRRLEKVPDNVFGRAVPRARPKGPKMGSVLYTFAAQNGWFVDEVAPRDGQGRIEGPRRIGNRPDWQRGIE
jgi:hypothetical protein